MPLQNRVNPAGELIVTGARGMFMGNRGILHDGDRRIVRTSRNSMWLICLLEFRGRRRTPMSAGTYTELFFLDEAVALAAGHRPCGECRRAEHRAFIAAASPAADPITGAKDLDRRLNRSRRMPRAIATVSSLPDGVFVTLGSGDFHLIWAGALHRWTPAGYVDPITFTDLGTVSAHVVTPALSVAALRNGYPVRSTRRPPCRNALTRPAPSPADSAPRQPALARADG